MEIHVEYAKINLKKLLNKLQSKNNYNDHSNKYKLQLF